MASEKDINLIFAAAVEKHPCLYNYNIPEYAKREEIEVAWNTVSKETNISVGECREKWKNIRSAFVRSLRASINAPSKSKRPYYLREHLEFLVPFVKPGSAREPADNTDYKTDYSESLGSFKEQENNEGESSMFYESEVEDQCQNDNETSTSSNIPHNLENTENNKRKRYLSDLDELFLRHLQENTTTVAEEMDAKNHFLLSLLPELKSLNESEMRQFKIKVLLLIENIKSARQ